MDQTFNQLDEGFHNGKSISIVIAKDIKKLKEEIKAHQITLKIIVASRNYAREQIKFLKTKDCINFEEYNLLKVTLKENILKAEELANKILAINNTVKLAEGSLSAVDNHTDVIEKAMEDFDNIYYLDDYTDDDAFAD